jgi:hypothetical protein
MPRPRYLLPRQTQQRRRRLLQALAPPALRSCTSSPLQPECEAQSTEDDWGAEPKGQYSHKAEDGADQADLRGAVARGPCASSPASEKDEERDSEDDDQGDEDHALAIVRPECLMGRPSFLTASR